MRKGDILYIMNINVMVAAVVAAVCLAGFYAAYLYGRKTKKFRWSEYEAIILVPILCTFILAYVYGVVILYDFLVSAIVGMLLEYTIGFVYHKTLNQRFWIYTRYTIGNGYTSWLTLPFWGFAGIVFWLIGKNVGI